MRSPWLDSAGPAQEGVEWGPQGPWGGVNTAEGGSYVLQSRVCSPPGPPQPECTLVSSQPRPPAGGMQGAGVSSCSLWGPLSCVGALSSLPGPEAGRGRGTAAGSTRGTQASVSPSVRAAQCSGRGGLGGAREVQGAVSGDSGRRRLRPGRVGVLLSTPSDALEPTLLRPPSSCSRTAETDPALPPTNPRDPQGSGSYRGATMAVLLGCPCV